MYIFDIKTTGRFSLNTIIKIQSLAELDILQKRTANLLIVGGTRIFSLPHHALQKIILIKTNGDITVREGDDTTM